MGSSGHLRPIIIAKIHLSSVLVDLVLNLRFLSLDSIRQLGKHPLYVQAGSLHEAVRMGTCEGSTY